MCAHLQILGQTLVQRVRQFFLLRHVLFVSPMTFVTCPTFCADVNVGPRFFLINANRLDNPHQCPHRVRSMRVLICRRKPASGMVFTAWDAGSENLLKQVWRALQALPEKSGPRPTSTAIGPKGRQVITARRFAFTAMFFSACRSSASRCLDSTFIVRRAPRASGLKRSIDPKLQRRVSPSSAFLGR